MVMSVRVVALSLLAALCAAAPRVDIKIVQRPKAEIPGVDASGPVAFRAPANPTGPFSTYVDFVGCVSNTNLELDGQSVWVDVCHLKNVTIVETPAGETTTAHSTDQETQDLAAGSEESNQAETAISDTAQPPTPVRKILGIFRGWKLDPIYKKFKYAVFDDGDLCEYGQRYSVEVELVRSAQTDIIPRVYDLKKVSTCGYKVRVEAYVPEYETMASSGIQTAGVLDISDADEMLPQICGEMKCQYTHVSTKIEEVKQEIVAVKKSLEELVTADVTSLSSLTLTAASSIIKSSTDIMEKALEMLETIERLDKETHEARTAYAAAIVTEQAVEVTATS